MRVSASQSGQALVEYLLVLVFVVIISIKGIGLFKDFFQQAVGSSGDILSRYLTTGVCEANCFFSGYRNGKQN